MFSISRPAEISKPRDTAGRYTSPACPWGIQQVLTPHYRIGYRVGEQGLIFADKAHAERFAQARHRRLVRPN